jgi:large subunit ribosomal protein L27
MSKTKSTGATKYLGVKLFDGQTAKPGMIIVRQRGTSILAGKNVKRGADDTLYSAKTGKVKFSTKRKKKFDGSSRTAKVVSVE